MKNCIGKDLSRIPVPVNFSEPLSMLQRISEDLQYSEILDKAVHSHLGIEQLCLGSPSIASPLIFVVTWTAVRKK